MGGQIKLTSKPGFGSTFSFTISFTPGVRVRSKPMTEIKRIGFGHRVRKMYPLILFWFQKSIKLSFIELKKVLFPDIR
jgi:hypothetical protein